jgi:pimeloyl-ACP methyl ester carboxylesterase
LIIFGLSIYKIQIKWSIVTVSITQEKILMKPNPHNPVGKLIDIGSHRLHIHATGEGSPAVVLETGGLSWCLDWHLVQKEADKFSRICSYDRAGFGWSDPGPLPRSSAQIVRELQALLTQSGIQQPYILVGASFGGHTARLYADTYPDEVAGIILVDARHKDINAKMPVAWIKMETAGLAMQRMMLLASHTGTLKL